VKWRILSTIVLWAVVLAVLYYGNVGAGIFLLAVLSTLAQHETHNLLEKCGYAPWRVIGLILGVALILGTGLSATPGNLGWLPAWIALILGLLRLAKKPGDMARLFGSVFAVIYIPDMLKYYGIILRDFGGSCFYGDGLGVVVWIIAVAKFTDVGAFVVGSAIGRTKLAPSISPGKTWEGVCGGLALGALVAALGAHFAPNYLPNWLHPRLAALLALPLGVSAIVSDLAESSFKRCAGVKDSGRCIPGIGGALDLIDSLLLTGPVAYYLLQYFAKHLVQLH
jgi:phosphatidate cytidylyltransferase